MTEPVRLAKRLAEMLACSRREAEQYIEGGFVTVNGVVVEEPQARVQNQSIVLLPGASLLALTPVTLLLHKPAGYESRDAANASGDAAKLLALLRASPLRKGLEETLDNLSASGPVAATFTLGLPLHDDGKARPHSQPPR